MASFGRQVLGNTGYPVEVTFDGSPEWKPGGITIDYSTVPAVGVDTVLPDGVTIRAGNKGIQFGTVMVKITATGFYGPANTTAADGRQTVDATRIGEVFVLNETVTQFEQLGLGSTPSDHPGVIAGGRVWKDRLQVGGANQPTLQQLLSAMPRLFPVEAN